MPVTGLFTMKPVRLLHDKVNTEAEYEHPESWRQNPKCHDVKYLKICSETAVMKQLRITWINLLRSCLMKTLILNKFAEDGETSSTLVLFLDKPEQWLIRGPQKVWRTKCPGWLFLDAPVLQERLDGDWTQPTSKMLNQCMQFTCHHYVNRNLLGKQINVSDCLSTHVALTTSSLQATWTGEKIVYLFLDTTSHILLLNFLGKVMFLSLNFPFSVTSITLCFFWGEVKKFYIPCMANTNSTHTFILSFDHMLKS